MPRYTFKCAACDHEFDAFVMTISDGDKHQKCPICDNDSKKVFKPSTFGVAGCPNTTH